MSIGLTTLIWTAAGIGFIHTIAGPDHYLPFVMLGRARGWPLVKTLWITALCGLGHVAGSVVLGFIGIGMGLAIHDLVSIESLRGEIAAWALLAFGLGYLAWGIRLAHRRRPHSHSHYHLDGSLHEHQHQHRSNHTHLHLASEGGSGVTPWALFVIFVLGPCEPLIPVLIFPASSASLTGILLVSAVFGLVTIATMVAITALLVLGARRLRFDGLGHWSHALAGGTLMLSGLFMMMMLK
jgi:ABC-type nickel/cobalt efflux system permease component RcnA